jgi:3-methylcrotonyl-CoA carboxylase beta subunit
MTAYHSTSELWDDGILDPIHTRDALAIALSVAVTAPPGSAFGDPGYGVFRM